MYSTVEKFLLSNFSWSHTPLFDCIWSKMWSKSGVWDRKMSFVRISPLYSYMSSGEDGGIGLGSSLSVLNDLLRDSIRSRLARLVVRLWAPGCYSRLLGLCIVALLLLAKTRSRAEAEATQCHFKIWNFENFSYEKSFEIRIGTVPCRKTRRFTIRN